jgi:ABC-type multidrug transport system permease subunit
VEGITKYVFPPVISIERRTTEKDQEEGSGLTMHSYMLPAMSIMFLLFICNIVFEDTLREKESGTLLRMMVSPMKLSEFIWSKIGTAILLGILCTFFIIGLGRILFSIQWGNPLHLFFVVLCLNILIAGFISFLYTFIRTERQAGALLSTVIIIMSALGGSMMPVQFYPSLIRNFSKVTVNYWGLEAFKKVILREPLRELFPILIGMLAVGILLSYSGSFLLNRNLRKGLFK